MNGKEQMGYDTWSHETILFPIVMVSKWARDSCHPIQEGSYGLVSNSKTLSYLTLSQQAKDVEPMMA